MKNSRQKTYTKQEVINLVKAELIKTSGSLTHAADGRENNFPYSVLGVIYAAIPDK